MQFEDVCHVQDRVVKTLSSAPTCHDAHVAACAAQVAGQIGRECALHACRAGALGHRVGDAGVQRGCQHPLANLRHHPKPLMGLSSLQAVDFIWSEEVLFTAIPPPTSSSCSGLTDGSLGMHTRPGRSTPATAPSSTSACSPSSMASAMSRKRFRQSRAMPGAPASLHARPVCRN